MSLIHNTIECASKSCFAIVTVHPQEEERLRRTGERFYCPAGHSMSFRVGKSEEQKRIENLERALSRAHRSVDGIHAQREDLIDHAKQCPLKCGWRARRHRREQSDWALGRMLDRIERDVIEHLAQEHGVEVPAETEEWLCA